jgi:hypothetical protein
MHWILKLAQQLIQSDAAFGHCIRLDWSAGPQVLR